MCYSGTDNESFSLESQRNTTVLLCVAFYSVLIKPLNRVLAFLITRSDILTSKGHDEL